MKRKGVTIWIILSFGTIAFGQGLKFFYPDAGLPFNLIFGGWMSSLLAIGYYVTALDTTSGKISYAGIIVMTAGIAFKILHWTGANEMIIIGVIVMVLPYAFALFRKKA